MSKPEKLMLVVDFDNCARCGKKHDKLLFRKFIKKCNTYTHWAMCPITNEPIVMKVVKETK